METLIEKFKFKRYSSYKYSGVEWIEDVPSHWEVKKFKRVFYEIKKRSNPRLNCGSISFGKVVYKDDDKIPESTKKSYQVVLKGDFLVNPLNLNYDLVSLRIALSEIDVVVSSGYIVLSNFVKIEKPYYKYFLHRFDVAFIKLLGSGVRQTLNYNDIANCDLVFPPLSEQTAIAAFLDHKTVLIDKAIEIKQKQIELLKERSQILIHKAVTRGINPNAKLKDSGVEWIGKIPEHWEITSLKRFCLKITDGSHYSPQTQFEGKNYISVKDIDKYGNINFDNCKKIAEKDFKVLIKSGSQPKANDILLTKDGTIGRAAIVTEYNDFVILSSLGIISPNTRIVIPEYLSLFLTSGINVSQMFSLIAGSALTRLTIEKISNLIAIFPPLKEQKDIIEYVKPISNKINYSILQKEKEIEKLKEYKSTLINGAVTGKIKVY